MKKNLTIVVFNSFIQQKLCKSLLQVCHHYFSFTIGITIIVLNYYFCFCAHKTICNFTVDYDPDTFDEKFASSMAFGIFFLKTFVHFVHLFHIKNFQQMLSDILVCWECKALLKKIQQFTTKVAHAQKILQFWYMNKQVNTTLM